MTRPKCPPYRETPVARPLSHCAFCGVAEYRCYTPTSSMQMAYRNPKTGLGERASQKKFASETFRTAILTEMVAILIRRNLNLPLLSSAHLSSFLWILLPSFSLLFRRRKRLTLWLLWICARTDPLGRWRCNGCPSPVTSTAGCMSHPTTIFPMTVTGDPRFRTPIPQGLLDSGLCQLF